MSSESDSDQDVVYNPLNRSLRSPPREPSPETIAELNNLNASINEAENFELTFEIVDTTDDSIEATDEIMNNSENREPHSGSKSLTKVTEYNEFGFEPEADEDETDEIFDDCSSINKQPLQVATALRNQLTSVSRKRKINEHNAQANKILKN